MTDLHLIVKVPNGCGFMSRSEYEGLPEPVKARVEILAVCPSEEKAHWICDHLPQSWRDVTLAWGPETPAAVEVVCVARAEGGDRGMGD
jgi:hypothetical protein